MPTFHAAQATWQTGVNATVTPNWPTGYSTAQAKDLAVCIVHSGASGGNTPATPTDWTQLATFNGGGGSHGNATGPRRTTIFTRELTAGAVPSAPAFSSMGASTIMGATIHIIRMDDPSASWSTFTATAEDTTAGTTLDHTFTAANGNIAAGDLIMVAHSRAQNGTVSGQTIVATGATVGTVTERHDQVNTSNPDVSGACHTASVTAGSNTANPTSAVTASVSSTSGAILVRFRETGGTSPTLVATSRDGQSDTNTASNTCPVPSGAQSGDIAVLAIEVFLDSGSAPITSVTWPSGFSQILDEQVNPSAGSQLLVAKKTLTGSDSGNYVTSWSGNRWNQSVCALIRGASSVSTPDSSSTKEAASGTSITSTSVTTSQLSVLLHIQSNSSSGSHTPPTNFVERQDSDYMTLATQVPGTTGSQTASGATQATSTAWIALLLAVEAASSGVTVGQPSTTDTVPGAVTRQKTRTPTQPSTTDTALPAARSKTRTVGQPGSSDSAHPATEQKTRLVGQPSTTDIALSLAGATNVPVGQPSTTDTAPPVTRQKVRIVGQPSTVDTAQPAAKAKQKTITLAATTDTAFAAARVKARTTGLPSTTDTALTVGRLKLRTLTQPATTDTARPVSTGGTIRIIVGQPATTDTALPVAKLKLKTTGLPSSTDTARPLSRAKLRILGQPSTLDETLASARLKHKPVGLPSTIDAGFAAARVKARTVGQPSTLDTAHRTYRPLTIIVGQPSTVDTARPVFNVAAVVPVVDGHLAPHRLTGTLPHGRTGTAGSTLTGRLTGRLKPPTLGGGI